MLRTRANPMSKWQGVSFIQNPNQFYPTVILEQVEMRRELRESRSEIDAEHQTVQSYGREREQRQTLAQLGLDEVEAVEYVLMLSRDEEIARRASLLSSTGEDGSAASTSASHTHPTNLSNQEDDLLFDMTDDFDMNLISPARIPPIKRDKDKSQSTSMSPVSSRRASISPHLRITPIPSPRHTPSLSSVSYSPTGSTKIQVSPRQRPEPMEASSNNMGLPMSPLSAGRSNVWQIPPRLSAEGLPSFGNGASSSRSVPASMSDWVSASISSRASASTSPGSPAFRASSSVSSLSRSMAPATGQRSWSDVARSSLPAEAVSASTGQDQPPMSGYTRSQVAPAQRPSRSLLSASLAANQRPAAPDSDDAQLQYVLQLSLAKASDREGA
jgi:hypothetical protein